MLQTCLEYCLHNESYQKNSEDMCSLELGEYVQLASIVIYCILLLDNLKVTKESVCP